MTGAPDTWGRPVLDDAQAQRIDLALLADKQARPGQPLVDGYEARRQANAIRLERNHPEGY